MPEQNETEKQQAASDQETPSERVRPDPSQLNAFEKFYEHFRGVPLKYLDIFIGVCFALLIGVIVVGVLKSHGIF